MEGNFKEKIVLCSGQYGIYQLIQNLLLPKSLMGILHRPTVKHITLRLTSVHITANILLYGVILHNTYYNQQHYLPNHEQVSGYMWNC